MRRKRVLVDLAKLKTLNCGLGQVALNFGLEIGKADITDLDINLLTPKKFKGFFGNNVNYLKVDLLYRHFSYITRPFDLWHATHQLSHFWPGYSKTPYLLTIHDLNFMYEKSSEKAEQYRRKIQRKIDRACMLVAISNFVAEEIRKYMNVEGKEIRVIYNGVKINSFGNPVKPVFIENAKPFLFTIGQVVAKKNFEALLDMMKLLPDLYLYICGEMVSDYSEHIRQRIENENIANVRLTGTITQEEKSWMYQNCRAFVFPSKFEGFGLPVIEAMLCGKPVFSSEMTSLKEIGGEYAFFWKNFEPEYMVQVLKEGLKTFDATPNWAEDEKKYAQEFSYEKHVQAYISLYKEILGI